MSNERDSLEARQLLGNVFLNKFLDEAERTATSRITGAAFGDDETLRNAAIELSVLKKFRSRLTLLAQKETTNE
jgi:hypothetical protein